MIQEILGYCLIKQQLIREPEIEILTEISKKETLIRWLGILESLIQSEFFIAANPEIFKKVRNIVRMKRFEYFDDSKVKSSCNFLIGYFNSYDALSENKKAGIYERWIQDETASRGIPKWIAEANPQLVLDYMARDFDNLCILLSQRTGLHESMDSLSCLSSTLWLMNKHTELLDFQEKVTVEDASNVPLLQLESGEHFIKNTSSAISDFLAKDSKKLPSYFRKNSNWVLKKLESIDLSEIKLKEPVVKKYPTM